MMEINEHHYLYKYRSLINLERFLDIILDRQLYGALYKEMNDPMEGYFRYSPDVDQALVRDILEGKGKRYICSLSRKPNIGLMWTHYADENRGCCLEVEVTSKTWERLDVEYQERVPKLVPNTTIQDILKVKAKMWDYEDEVRFLSPQIPEKKNRPYLKIKIHRIIFGFKVDTKKVNHLRKIIKALDPQIEIERMKIEDLYYGFK